MSLLWFYHPEHTEAGRKPQHAPSELFVMKHIDRVLFYITMYTALQGRL